MARFLKNPDIGTSISQAAKLPIVPSSSYGDTPTNGLIRFNQATNRIEFYYNGIRNPNIPNISTCVLSSIDVDYAPKGFHTFESPKDTTPKYGSTGMPFAIRMSLGFQETDIMTKLNYQSEENRIRLGE